MVDMFSPSPTPRVFTLPPGVNFAECLVAGIRQRLASADSSAIARLTIWTNTRRSARAIEEIFANGPASFLPRIKIISDIAKPEPIGLGGAAVPPVPGLQRKLFLAELLAAVLQKEPNLAPRSAIFDLADSLADLLDELENEGRDLRDIVDLDTGEFAQQWETNRKLISVLANLPSEMLKNDSQFRHRATIEMVANSWNGNPTTDPVLVAGSTGSRGATAMFMRAVAHLPQGAVILPGFDTSLGAKDWQILPEDHPQRRVSAFVTSLGLSEADIATWVDVSPHVSERNALVALALLPAPVTNDWIKSAPALLPILTEATTTLSLMEAESQRAEALAIAVKLRHAFADGRKAALVTPDQNLARRVRAALAQWAIHPDDSAGTALSMTSPGIFLREVLLLVGGTARPVEILAVLNHPLCGGVGLNRMSHLEHTRTLEKRFFRGGPPEISANILRVWVASRQDTPDGFHSWCTWLADLLQSSDPGEDSLSAFALAHFRLAESLSRGRSEVAGQLWLKDAGDNALTLMQSLCDVGKSSFAFTQLDYTALFRSELNKAAEIRDEAFVPHQQIVIWGTLEARIQSADLMILGGLNESVWPPTPPADPWLNRGMRLQVGLPSLELRVGLSAHDFQQAIAAKEVVLSRTLRDQGAPTLPSRWLARLTNLLNGMGVQGADALAGMKARGDAYLHLSALHDAPTMSDFTPLAPRPAPSPPIVLRPKTLSVTQIETLIRDPYAIYARFILKLRRLDPIGREPDQLERGSALHDVMHAFIDDTIKNPNLLTPKHLISTAETVLADLVPWPDMRRLWVAQISRVSQQFVAAERQRRKNAVPLLLEQKGAAEITLQHGTFTLTGKADRIDLMADGSILIYDYKSGAPPEPKDISNYAKQLLLEGMMVERGGFAELGLRRVSRLEYLTLSISAKDRDVDLGDSAKVWAELTELLHHYESAETGYPARIRSKHLKNEGEFDHLSRRGEWEDGADYKVEKL